MVTVWIVIAVAALGSAAIKAAGPAVLGEQELPPRARDVIALLAPALLAALVVADTFGSDRRLEFDAHVVGIAVAALALVLRAPMLVVVGVAVVATALTRLLL